MITLIGQLMAKKDNSFIFQGQAEECENCRFKATCVDSLEEGRKYIIKDIKESQLKCPLTDSIVVPVEISLADIEMYFDSHKVFEGSNFIYTKNQCEFKECNNYKLCFPEGLQEGDKITIAKDLRESPECKDKRFLKKILARF